MKVLPDKWRWAERELEQAWDYGLTVAQINLMIRRSVAAGLWGARYLRRVGQDQNNWPTQLGFRLIYKSAGVRRVPAEYDEVEQAVYFYTEQIHEIEEHYCKQTGSSILADFKASFDDLCLLHEAFHHLEHTRFGRVDRRVAVKRQRLGFLTQTIFVRETREIAAHAFVMAVLGLRQSPAEIGQRLFDQGRLQ